jgi:hypothetical protein
MSTRNLAYGALFHSCSAQKWHCRNAFSKCILDAQKCMLDVEREGEEEGEEEEEGEGEGEGEGETLFSPSLSLSLFHSPSLLLAPPLPHPLLPPPLECSLVILLIMAARSGDKPLSACKFACACPSITKSGAVD